MRSQQAAAKKKAEAAAAQVVVVDLDGEGASSSAFAQPRRRKFYPLVTDGWTQAKAKEHLPQGCGYGVTKDTKENRWRCRGRGMAEISRSYGKGSGITDWEAMVTVLNYVWAHHIRLNGGECPFVFVDA